MQLLKKLMITRHYSTNGTQQKFFEILNDINKSKDTIKNITVINWDTGFQNGHTLMFKFSNQNNTYEGEILVRNITKNNEECENEVHIDNTEFDYLKDKSEEFAKNN